MKFYLKIWLVVCCCIFAVRASGQILNLNGTKVVVLIPADMSFVQMLPHDINTRSEMSILSYRFTVVGSEIVYGLHWDCYVTDNRNRILNQYSWWDRGEWSSKSPIESSAVIETGKRSQYKLMIILREVESNIGLRSFDDPSDAEKKRITGNQSVESVKVNLVPHVDISREDQKSLLARSLNAVLTKAEIRKTLSLNSGAGVVFFLKSDLDANTEARLETVSSERVRESIKKGQPLSYFEYAGVEALGASVKLTLDYHVPTVNERTYIDRGIRVDVFYSKLDGQYVFDRITTTHF